mmetsp:Transcript_41589/g.106422  ORF Transcript_41589/g.106422 Transcript_41589/m.106422 type:complete len:248 (+) Transcript_41589:2453-3196(+)
MLEQEAVQIHALLQLPLWLVHVELCQHLRLGVHLHAGHCAEGGFHGLFLGFGLRHCLLMEHALKALPVAQDLPAPKQQGGKEHGDAEDVDNHGDDDEREQLAVLIGGGEVVALHARFGREEPLVATLRAVEVLHVDVRQDDIQPRQRDEHGWHDGPQRLAQVEQLHLRWPRHHADNALPKRYLVIMPKYTDPLFRRGDNLGPDDAEHPQHSRHDVLVAPQEDEEHGRHRVGDGDLVEVLPVRHDAAR